VNTDHELGVLERTSAGFTRVLEFSEALQRERADRDEADRRLDARLDEVASRVPEKPSAVKHLEASPTESSSGSRPASPPRPDVSLANEDAAGHGKDLPRLDARMDEIELACLKAVEACTNEERVRAASEAELRTELIRLAASIGGLRAEAQGQDDGTSSTATLDYRPSAAVDSRIQDAVQALIGELSDEKARSLAADRDLSEAIVQTREALGAEIGQQREEVAELEQCVQIVADAQKSCDTELLRQAALLESVACKRESVSAWLQEASSPSSLLTSPITPLIQVSPRLSSHKVWFEVP